MTNGMSRLDRFNNNVIPEPNSGCWLWYGSLRGKFGYGQFHLDHNTPIAAHRYSYLIHNGPILGSEIIMHMCDNPICVNPAHLRKGTTQDNIVDKVSKNRQAKGSTIGTWKGGVSYDPREYLRQWRKLKKGVAS